MTEDEMIGWQHPHNGHGLEQALEDREGQEIVVLENTIESPKSPLDINEVKADNPKGKQP